MHCMRIGIHEHMDLEISVGGCIACVYIYIYVCMCSYRPLGWG